MPTPGPDNEMVQSEMVQSTDYSASRETFRAWRKLEQHAGEMRDVTLREPFDADPGRADDLAIDDLGMYVDFGKNRISAESPRLLVALAEQCGLRDRIGTMFSGQWRGHTCKPVRNLINIGIGGSDLGPRMAYQALRPFSDRGLNVEFVSNIDGAEFVEAARGLDPAQTLFIVSSKSWHTLETLTNAAGVARFGIDPANMFGFWDWVGGRYSVDSAIGLSLMVAIGPENFTEMLAGFHDVEEHLRTVPLERNILVLMGLISVWYNNFLGAQTQAVLPYSHYLADLPANLQQLETESNGRHVTLAGEQVDYQTGQIIWGQPGTNGQHAFYQLIHQGTKLIPCDFIAVVAPLSALEHQHDLLTANVFTQTEGLAFGRSAEELPAAGSPEEQIPHRVCKGNQPT